MTDVGYIALLIALVVAIYGIVASVVGGRRNMSELVASGRNAIYAVSALVLMAALVLWRALLTNQFELEYVAGHTERSLPFFYKFSAFWGGQAGSLTFWLLLLCGYAVAATWFFRKELTSLKPYVNAVLLLTISFFLVIVIFAANPFEKLWHNATGQVITAVFAPAGGTLIVPADGQGLSPQLQNYWMVIHPVALYMGFIGMTVPFAFAVAALVTGQLGNTWIKAMRKWILVPWIFLSVGILLGSQWAYVELGWGGYWAWDPVENASLLPWLTATPFIHSIMIQERRGMLKPWNMVLIWFTWELTLLGTFMTRSGVIQSVHSFALSPIGPMFAAFIIATMLAFVVLLAIRWPLLRSENELDGVLSRETAFLSQNVLFVVLMLAVLVGTWFAPISEIITGNKIALNAPYFKKVAGPLFATLVFLMGAAPLLSWRRSSPETLRRNFVFPVAAAIVTVPVMVLLGNRTLAGFIGVAALAFVLAGVIQEYVRGVRARQHSTGEALPRALVTLVQRNGRRYGGYLIHVGVLMVALGIIGNEFYQSQGTATLSKGQSLPIANYTLTYRNYEEQRGPNYVEGVTTLDITRNGRPAGEVVAKKVFYDKAPDQPITVVGLRPGPIEDIYVVLAGFDPGGTTASFKAFVNPLMSWMWIGGLMLIFGTLVAAWPRRSHATAEARVRVPATTTTGLRPTGGN